MGQLLIADKVFATVTVPGPLAHRKGHEPDWRDDYDEIFDTELLLFIWENG